MNIKIIIILFIIICRYIFPDILPPQYEGYSIKPINNDNIRLKIKTVDIYWYDTCRVSAELHMENLTKETVKMSVSFPPRLDPDELNKSFQGRSAFSNEPSYALYRFKVNLNGKEIKEFKKEKYPDYSRPRRIDYKEWYGWENTFRPGENIMTLEYNIAPGYSGRARRKNIYYIMSTAAPWNGNIEKVKVTVHFPEPIQPGQVHESTVPAGYKIIGKKVMWNFKNIEPTRKDDIRLEIIPFDLYKKLKYYKKQLKRASVAESTRVNAAKFYLTFGNPKGIWIAPPGSIEKSYVENKLLPAISNKNDMAFFLKIYKKDEKAIERGDKKYLTYRWEGYSRNKPGLKEKEKKIVQILSNADYLPQEPFGRPDTFSIKARSILEDVLHKNPSNTRAWHIYFMNYYKMYFSGCSPRGFGGNINYLQNRQKKAIKKAYRYCKNDKGIRLWYSIINYKRKLALPDTLGRLYGRPNNKRVEIFGLGHGGHRGIIRTDKAGLDFIFQFYSKDINNNILKRNNKISEKDTKSLIALIDSSGGYYRGYHGKELRDFYNNYYYDRPSPPKRPSPPRKIPKYKKEYVILKKENDKEYGKYISWDEKGNKGSEIHYIRDTNDNYIKHGKAAYWHKNDKKRSEGHYKNDIKDGKFTDWHENGKKESQEEYKNGMRHGKSIRWDQNGKKIWEYSYKNGIRHGKCLSWYRDSIVSLEKVHKIKEINGKWSGWYKKRQIKEKVFFKNDKRDGMSTEWYSNGQKKWECNFKNGNQHGVLRSWYENGQQEFEWVCVDGIGHGRHIRWDVDGNIIKKEFYKDGVKVEENK